MTSPSSESDILKAWQTQATEPLAMSIQEIRERVGTFEEKIRRRNRREYVAASLVIAWFGFYTITIGDLFIRIGSFLVVVASAFVMRQLYRRGSSAEVPEAAGLLTAIDFYRSELVRQRDLLHSVWFWYIGPFLPGAVLLYIGAFVRRPENAWITATSALVFVAVLAYVWRVNWRTAKKLQQHVDELDGLKNGE